MEKTVKEVMVPMKNLLYGTMDSNVVYLFKEMCANDFTNVPILDGDHLCGILREKTALELICEGNFTDFDELTVQSIEHLVSLKQVCLSHFYEFVSPETNILELLTLFSPKEGEDCRFDLVIVTDNGRSSGKILGIVTPWNLFQ